MKKGVRNIVVMFLAACCIMGNLPWQVVNASAETYRKKCVADIKLNDDKRYNALEITLKAKEPATVKVTVVSGKGKQKAFQQKLRKGRNRIIYYMDKSQTSNDKSQCKVAVKAKKALLGELRCTAMYIDVSVGYKVN